jgi:2,3-bisphosphoglycerate-independent phosphoglycerate mutase
MTRYAAALDALLGAIFTPVDLSGTLGETVAAAGLRQLRVAETEKYAHVTFFLDGGCENEREGERHVLIPSPQVPTYDLKPEMSAAEVTDVVVTTLDNGEAELVVVNYANPDMVGHTGNMAAAKRAVETVDVCLARIETAVQRAGGTLLVTADHGNVEQMRDPETGEPHTAHTVNKVPLVLACGTAEGLEDGSLADVAPTVLAMMGLAVPAEMSGHSLLALAAPKPRHSAAG